MQASSSQPTKIFVLLDRDGTIIFDRHHLADPDGVELLPGAAEGLRRLTAAGLGLAVVTNQPGIARGLFVTATLEAMHDRLRALLAAEQVTLDGIYYCPHDAADQCRCRKPQPGLAEAAARELGFNPRRAFVVGDKAADVDLGRSIGATTILVRTGHGAEAERASTCVPDYIVDDLKAAADVICRTT